MNKSKKPERYFIVPCTDTTCIKGDDCPNFKAKKRTNATAFWFPDCIMHLDKPKHKESL